MKQHVFNVVLGLILVGTSPIIAHAQESPSPAPQQKTSGPAPVSGPVITPADGQVTPPAKGKVTLWGMTLTKGSIDLPDNGTLSLKEALQRANYYPLLLKSARPEFIIYGRDHQQRVVNFSALTDGKPDVLLSDGDFIFVSMELLNHTTILGDVKAGDNFYFGKDEHPTLADVVRLAGGMTDESANDSVTVVHVNFLHDAKGKTTMHSSLGDHFDATLDPADPRWQQTIENNDWVLVYSKRLTLKEIWPEFESQDAPLTETK